MLNRSTAALIATAFVFAIGGRASADEIKFHSINDGSVYDKPFTNLKGQWNNEFGVGAPLVTTGPWVAKWNLAYIQTFPLKSSVKPQWTAGGTIVYEFGGKPVVPGLYSKIKNNLQGLWQQESGFTARTRVGQYGLVFNAGYIFDYPRNNHAAPKWQIGLNFNYYFHK